MIFALLRFLKFKYIFNIFIGLIGTYFTVKFREIYLNYNIYINNILQNKVYLILFLIILSLIIFYIFTSNPSDKIKNYLLSKNNNSYIIFGKIFQHILKIIIILLSIIYKLFFDIVQNKANDLGMTSCFYIFPLKPRLRRSRI